MSRGRLSAATMRRARLLAERVATLTGGRRYRRFVIIGVARTGSTALVSLLNAHGQALCFGELFRQPDAIGWDVSPWADRRDERMLRLYRTEPLRFLERAVWRRHLPWRRAVGFKLFHYHAREAPFKAVWDYLRDDCDVAILHLKRRNLLAQYLSLQLAHRTNVWVTTDEAGSASAPIRLEPDACARHFADVRAQEAQADRFFAAHPVLQVTYEDLAADRIGVMDRVAEFLGLRRRLVDTPLRRQRRTPMAVAIANFDELAASFAGGPWAAFFDAAEG